MNCKPGDLAVIVGAGYHPEHLGKFVTCIAWQADMYGGCWRTTPMLKDKWGRNLGWHDADLRPIRDPGDDASDEMLRPLPEEVAA